MSFLAQLFLITFRCIYMKTKLELSPIEMADKIVELAFDLRKAVAKEALPRRTLLAGDRAGSVEADDRSADVIPISRKDKPDSL